MHLCSHSFTVVVVVAVVECKHMNIVGHVVGRRACHTRHVLRHWSRGGDRATHRGLIITRFLCERPPRRQGQDSTWVRTISTVFLWVIYASMRPVYTLDPKIQPWLFCCERLVQVYDRYSTWTREWAIVLLWEPCVTSIQDEQDHSGTVVLWETSTYSPGCFLQNVRIYDDTRQHTHHLSVVDTAEHTPCFNLAHDEGCAKTHRSC